MATRKKAATPDVPTFHFEFEEEDVIVQTQSGADTVAAVHRAVAGSTELSVGISLVFPDDFPALLVVNSTDERGDIEFRRLQRVELHITGEAEIQSTLASLEFAASRLKQVIGDTKKGVQTYHTHRNVLTRAQDTTPKLAIGED